MDQNDSFTQNIDALFTNLEEFTKNESVMGKPTTYGNKTLIPIVSVTLGYGSGAPKGQQNNNNSTTLGTKIGMGAMGLGARINTEAIVVIDKDNVSMLPISDKSNMGQMIDKIPQVLMNLNQKGQQNQQNQQVQQGQDQSHQVQPQP